MGIGATCPFSPLEDLDTNLIMQRDSSMILEQYISSICASDLRTKVQRKFKDIIIPGQLGTVTTMMSSSSMKRRVKVIPLWKLKSMHQNCIINGPDQFLASVFEPRTVKGDTDKIKETVKSLNDIVIL